MTEEEKPVACRHFCRSAVVMGIPPLVRTAVLGCLFALINGAVDNFRILIRKFGGRQGSCGIGLVVVVGC